MMRLAIAIVGTATLAIACDQPHVGVKQSDIEFLAQQNGALVTRVNAIEERLAEAENALKLARQLANRPGFRRQAVVSTDNGLYGIAATSIGPFTVTVQDVKPYMDGFRLQMTLGNLSAATANGAKLKIRFAPTLLALLSDEGDQSTVQEREISITDCLYPGTWNKVSVTLTPATAEALRNLTVEIEVEQVLMRG